MTQTKIARVRRTWANAVLTEVIRNGVIAVTEEMKVNLRRTAYNIIIYEALDFTVGLFTPEGETVSIGLGLPMFIRGMAETLKAKLAHFGRENLRPGDILVTNDAYLTGSHLNHVTLSLPIFYRGVLCGFSCCMAHWQDIGGALGGITTDIYSEGLQIPIMKYQSAGKVNEDLLKIIRMNVRFPEQAMGDLRAQITAVKTGERRFIELLDRYGQEPVLSAIRSIMDQSEASARARTRSIPNGVYEAESYMDDDGVEIGKRVPIKVRVTVSDAEMTIDLSEVGAQVRGFYNSGTTTAYACAQVAYKCLTSPTDYPVNEGSFRPLKVIVPSGTIVSAVRPAAMRWWMTYPMTIVDTVFRAMARAIPERTIAGHHADLCAGMVHGLWPKDKRLFIGSVGLLGGGWGAKWNEDGVSATICINDGDTHNVPIEQREMKAPVLTRRYALRQDSGGAGHFRGGLGVEKVIEALAPAVFDTQIDRVHCAPWGLAGGNDGMSNDVELEIGGRPRRPPNGKVYKQALKPGDLIIMRTGGGGGFGPPVDRAAEKVAHDVAEGYVSREQAFAAYGVVLNEDGEVDAQATRDRRKELRGG